MTSEIVEAQELQPFQLEILNFQSLRHAKIDLSGFCTIQGPTDSGKSAVVRALRSILFNEWDPAYLRDGAGECHLHLTIPLHVSDKVSKVSLFKSDKRNEYRVEFRDGPPKSYPKIGRDTPPEMKEMGFEIVTTERGDKFNLNVQPQLKSLFLVTDTGVQITSFFNTIFNVAKYERANRSINADLQRITYSTNSVRDRALAKRTEHTKHKEDVEALTVSLESIRGQLKKVEALVEQESQLSGVTASITDYSYQIEQGLSAQQAKLKQLTLLSSYLTVVKKGESLLAITNQIESLQREVSVQASAQSARTGALKIATTQASLLSAFTSASVVLREMGELSSRVSTSQLALVTQRTGQRTLHSVANLLPKVISVSDIGASLWSANSSLQGAEANHKTLNNGKATLYGYTQAVARYSLLKSVGTELHQTFVATNKEQERLSSLTESQRVLSKESSKVGTLIPLRTSMMALYDVGIRLTSAQQEVERAEGYMSQANSSFATLIEYDKAMKAEIKVCPTCHSPFSTEHAH